MSDKIAVRLADGQVIEVPAMRLDWATRHPRLCELMDEIAAITTGTAPPAPTIQRLAQFNEFLALVREVSGCTVNSEGASVNDVARIHAALRGVTLPDPTVPPGPG